VIEQSCFVKEEYRQELKMHDGTTSYISNGGGSCNLKHSALRQGL